MDADLGQTVLVIDPEAPFRHIINKAISPLGCYVIETSSCAEGMDIALRQRPDLIILDLDPQIPDEGLQVCQELVQGEQAIGALVFLTSSRNDVQLRINGFKAGAVDFLHKPFIMEELRARVSMHLRLRASAKRESRRLKARQEKEKSDFIQTFVLGIAHNFNNLLTAGLGFLHLTRDGITDRRSLGHLRNLELVQERMCELARQLIMLAGDYNIAKRPVVLRNVVFGALAMFDAAALKHGVTLVCDFSRLKQAQVLADEFQLIQAMLQILGNAREAMRGVGGQVHLGGHLEDNEAVIEIRDTGRGMTPEVLAHVRDPFYTTKQDVGVGLSLAAVDRLVRDFGGRMLIDSEQNVGTTVQIRLPLLLRAVEVQPQHASSFRSGLSVLLAVDSPETQRALQQVLLAEEVLTEQVGNLKELSEALQTSERYDAVIVDLLRSALMGDELAASLRMKTAAPLLFLYSSEQEKPKQTDSIEVLLKPFRPEDLLTALKQFPGLQNHQAI